jgi:hypothetical protein
MRANEIISKYDLFDCVNTLWEMQVHIDVTTIARNFGKDVNDWFKSFYYEKGVKELEKYKSDYDEAFFDYADEDTPVHYLFRDEVTTEKCAFVHSSLILDFAYWLSGDFEAWYESDVPRILNLNDKKDQEISKVIVAILDNEKTCFCGDVES